MMPPSPRIALYPGSFDPVTNGHLDIIARAGRLFDRVVVAILVNPAKQPWFTAVDRAAMIREACASQEGVDVETFDGLLVDLARRHQARTVVRGLRGASDLDSERQMSMMNRHLSGNLDTVFFMPSVEFAHISSTLVREIVSLGGSVTGLVPPKVEARLYQRREGALTRKI
jgi:pantetheine-phosphate adenylyltransferase